MWTLLGWLIAALATVYAVVVRRWRDADSPIDPDRFESLHSQVQRLERDVAEWHDYVSRWTKRLDMRQRRAAGEVEESEPPHDLDRKMALRRVIARNRE